MALGMGLALATSALFRSVAADGATPATLVPATTIGVPKSTAFGALDYFQAKCARCHGDYGLFYGETFGKNLDDTKMHAVVRDMAAGPAQAPLETKNLSSRW
jgi:hypothetical protein